MTTTDTTPVVAPEVAAIRTQLAAIPADWMNDRLEESAVRRATMQALHRVLGQRATMAEVTEHVALDALAAVTNGDPAGVDELIDAQVRKDAAGRLRERLIIPPIDPDALALAFQVAEVALRASDEEIAVPAVSLDAEIVAWRALCRARGFAFDPPVADDLSRAASRKAAPLAAESEQARDWYRMWRGHVADPTIDQLALLASAGGVVGQRADLAARVADARKLIGSANDARVRAGLVWSPDSAVVS